MVTIYQFHKTSIILLEPGALVWSQRMSYKLVLQQDPASWVNLCTGKTKVWPFDGIKIRNILCPKYPVSEIWSVGNLKCRKSEVSEIWSVQNPKNRKSEVSKIRSVRNIQCRKSEVPEIWSVLTSYLSRSQQTCHETKGWGSKQLQSHDHDGHHHESNCL